MPVVHIFSRRSLISIKQVDEWADEAIVVVDRARALELIEALEAVLGEPDAPAPAVAE